MFEDFFIALIIVLVMDRAAFWYLMNMALQFFDPDENPTYSGTIFPRIIALLAGVGIFAFGKFEENDILIGIGMVLAIGSHFVVYLYLMRSVKASIKKD